MRIAAERSGRNLLSQLLGTLFPLPPLQAADLQQMLEKTPSPKVLFIRAHQGLGDFLLATPVFRAMKQAYPSVQIHVVASPYNEKAIRGSKRLSKIWIWENAQMLNPFRFFGFLRKLRTERFTLAIPLASNIPSFTSYLLARLSGAKAVLAYDTRSFYGGATWSRHLVNHAVLPPSENAPEWVKFHGVLKPLMKTFSSEDFAPEFETDAASEAWAAAEWKRIYPEGTKKKIGVFLGGNTHRPERIWPAEYWAQLSARLQKHPDVFLVAIVPAPHFVIGTHAPEKGIYELVLPSLMVGTPAVTHQDLKHLAAFLKGLDLFVAMDGGIFHMAVAAGVRTLGLFFGTDPACWKAPVPSVEALRPADEKPTSLPPDQVYEQIEQMVLKSKAATRS